MRDDQAVEVESTELLRTLIMLMFHGRNERIDAESLRLSAEMWEALCRDFLS